MNALELLLETTPMRALGWTLVHFVWQGVALFVVHEALQLMLRKRSASARYVASCLVLLAMLASAGLTMRLEMQRTPVGVGNVLAQTTSLVSPVQRTSDDTAREGATPHAVASRVSDPHSSHVSSPLSSHHAHDQSGRETAERSGATSRFRELAMQPLNFLHGRAPRLGDLLPWLVSFWWVGVFLLTTRLAIGWQEARWLRSRAVRPLQPSMLASFEELLQQLRISRPVKIMESALAEVPTVVGWLRPVVLLPTAAVTGLSPRHLEALIAHELTHVRRHDYLVNLLQTMIETLLFYHPAVWWVSNRIRDERENCCDDVAVQICGNAVLYARALTNMEELRGGGSRPELAMAADGGSLVQRVRRLVGRGGAPTTPGAGVVVGAVLVALSTLLAVSAGRTTESAQTWQPAHSESSTTFETEHLGGRIAGIQEAQPAPQLPDPGAISQPAFELDEIIRMEQVGVDVDFYQDMTELFGELEVDELVALKTYHVDRQFAEEMQAWFGKLGFEELIALKVFEVDVHYVEDMSEFLDEELEYEEVLRLSQQGVQSCDVKKLVEHGVDVDVHEAIELQLMGVDENVLQEFLELQMPGASTQDRVQMARVGLDVDDVDELQEELGPLSVDLCIALLTTGVDANEVEELRDMGMDNPDPELLVHMYSMGLSADVIDTILDLDDDMEDVSVEALLLFKELGLEDVFLEEFRRRNPR